jgi:hypothetical protein
VDAYCADALASVLPQVAAVEAVSGDLAALRQRALLELEGSLGRGLADLRGRFATHFFFNIYKNIKKIFLK